MKSPDEDARPAQPADVSAPTEDRLQASSAANSDGVPILSESLLRGRNAVQILHRGELYRLCLTRAGKLILHK
jgi:hemin uptake protein HemP